MLTYIFKNTDICHICPYSYVYAVFVMKNYPSKVCIYKYNHLRPTYSFNIKVSLMNQKNKIFVRVSQQLYNNISVKDLCFV